MKVFEQEIQNKNYNNLRRISRFLTRNKSQNEQIVEMLNKLPLIIKNEIYDEFEISKEDIKEKDIDELLHNILTDDDLEHNDFLLKILFDLMMKDDDNLFCYLSYLVSQKNLPYEIYDYFSWFFDEYNKYHDMFIKVTNELFDFVESEYVLIIRNNFKLENFKISEFGVSIVSKIFDSLKENPVCNYQAFICLQNIACTVPILFNSNIQQVFDSILEPFNNLYLLFENNNKDEKTILLTKTAYASLSFLLSSFQSSLVLDHFVKWLFPNIENFSNSQIYGFLYILKCLSSKKNVFYSFIPSTYKEYDLFSKVAVFLNRKITEGSNFEKEFKNNVYGFLDRVLYGFSTFNPYVICQNELLSKIDNKFTYFYSNIFSTFIEYRTYPIIAIDANIRIFINSIYYFKKYWINFDVVYKETHPIDEQLTAFIDELPHHARYVIPENDKVLDKPISIRMAKYIVMRPLWIYDIFLFNREKIYSKDQSELYFTTLKKLRELQVQARENPQDEENADVETLSSIDYFTPIINRSEFINNLIDQIMLDVSNDLLCTIFLYLTRYPIIYKKILECLNLKITEYSFNHLYLYQFINILQKMKFHDDFMEIFFDLFGNNLINIILSPKCRNNSILLIKAAEYFNMMLVKPPIRITQIISFLILLNTDVSIILALKLCKHYNENELRFINDSLLNLFDDLISKKNSNLLITMLNNVPFIINSRKLESFSLLSLKVRN